jgi:hypothetical protein
LKKIRYFEKEIFSDFELKNYFLSLIPLLPKKKKERLKLILEKKKVLNEKKFFFRINENRKLVQDLFLSDNNPPSK